LNQVAGSGEQIRALRIRHDEKRLELAQIFVQAPILRQLDHRALHVAAVFLELGFESGKERKRIGSGSGESREHAVAVEFAHLRRAVFHHRISDGDLTVAGHRHCAVFSDAEDGGAVNYIGFHGVADGIKSSGGGASMQPIVSCSSFQACSISRDAFGPP